MPSSMLRLITGGINTLKEAWTRESTAIAEAPRLGKIRIRLNYYAVKSAYGGANLNANPMVSDVNASTAMGSPKCRNNRSRRQA